MRRARRLTATGAGLGLLLVLLAAAGPAAAQVSAAADTSGGFVIGVNPPPGMALPPGTVRPGLEVGAAITAEAKGGPFVTGFENEPKAGVKANVTRYEYYGELTTRLKMRKGSVAENDLGWSWSDYRKQQKTIERRSNFFNWGAGTQLPFIANLTANWDWSEDRTVNAAGVDNLAKRDFKSIGLMGNKSKLRTGRFLHTIKFDVGYDEQQAQTQNQRNDFSEATGLAGLQTGYAISDGVVIAGRLWGSLTGGDRALGALESPSSADKDSLGIGIYYQKRLAAGRVHVTRANFDKRYLDYKRNANGLVDTVKDAGAENIVDELEAKDVLSMEFENSLRVGRVELRTLLARDTDDLAYAQSGIGTKTKQTDEVDVSLRFAAWQDSFTVDYGYVWRWDDQRYKNATANRGRQYVKSRDLGFAWYRTLFARTDMTFKMHQGLSQDIAQNEHNENDKDKLDTDASLQLSRLWSRFRTTLGFNWKSVEDLSIRESRSANNNLKDSYEIVPKYTWDVAEWLRLQQDFRLYIQYTDYVYSGYENVNRQDNYNKRGILNTRLTIEPTERLTVTIRHDYNQRFNATKAATDASGNTSYSRDLDQITNRLDFGLRYEAGDAVTLEAATYRSRDDKTTYGTVDRVTETFAGQLWVGARVNQKWGEKDPLELSARVKKYNAFGPTVTATSADYWEADVWLKWSF